MSLPIDTSWPTAEVGGSLREDVADAWWRVRARARNVGAPHHLALRVRVPDVDPLDVFIASSSTERFFWSHPEAGIERAAEGEVWSFSVEARTTDDRFEGAGQALADVLERLEVIGDPAPVSAGPIVHAGFAYAERAERAERAADGEWAAFPAARLTLAGRQVARTATGSFECRIVRVEPDAPDDGWMDLFTPLPTERPSRKGTARQAGAAQPG